MIIWEHQANGKVRWIISIQQHFSMRIYSDSSVCGEAAGSAWWMWPHKRWWIPLVISNRLWYEHHDQTRYPTVSFICEGWKHWSIPLWSSEGINYDLNTLSTTYLVSIISPLLCFLYSLNCQYQRECPRREISILRTGINHCNWSFPRTKSVFIITNLVYY